jgi:hypothetical protein
MCMSFIQIVKGVCSCPTVDMETSYVISKQACEEQQYRLYLQTYDSEKQDAQI